MLTYLLTIEISGGNEDTAIETLSGIERVSRLDEGCLQFTWFQHENEANRFTLVEQWESKQHLDAHLEKIIPIWEKFTPQLAGEPVSQSLVPLN